MSRRVEYAARILRPDGVVIEVHYSAPADRPDVGELGELAQMTAESANNLLNSNDAARERTRRDDEVPF